MSGAGARGLGPVIWGSGSTGKVIAPGGLTNSAGLVMGMISTEWVNFTVASTWTANSTHVGKWRRMGDSMEIRVTTKLTGAPTAAAYGVTVPASEVMDITKLNDSFASTVDFVGAGFINDNSTQANRVLLKVFPNTSTQLQLVASGASIVSDTIPFTFTTSDSIGWMATVPIVGWTVNT